MKITIKLHVFDPGLHEELLPYHVARQLLGNDFYGAGYRREIRGKTTITIYTFRNDNNREIIVESIRKVYCDGPEYESYTEATITSNFDFDVKKLEEMLKEKYGDVIVFQTSD